MAELTDAQRKRKEARERRRGSEPEQSDDTDSSDAQQPLDAVKSAAKVAAAGAAVGAAAAAARALGSRHEEDGADEPQAEAGPDPEQSDEGESQPQPQAQQEQEEEPQPQDRQEPEDEPRAEQVEEQDEQESRHDRRKEPVEGESLKDAGKAATQARQQLEELLGKPAESVSSLERTHDGWVVVLEVVELRRIPESTDVLASYELELDDDLNFRRYQQAARYTRSQASRGEES